MENNAQKKTGLDALRGIGITGIVLYHVFPTVFRGGFLGVPLFFVLSGYLMFMTGERDWKRGSFRIGAYYSRRFRKIMPSLFVMVMMVCCFLTLTKSELLIGLRQELCGIFLGYDNWWQIAKKASYFSRLACSSPFTHLWFLAVEIQFYLLWPFLFLLYKKASVRLDEKKLCFVFPLLALLSAGKMFFLYTPGEDPSRVYYGTDTMAFSLFIGIFLGALVSEHGASSKGRPLSGDSSWFGSSSVSDIGVFAGGNTFGHTQIRTLLSSLFLVVVTVLFLTVDGQSPLLYQGGMFFISLFFACAVYIAERLEIVPAIDTAQNTKKRRQPTRARRVLPLLSLLGRKSYGIYLWHYPILVLALL